MKKCNHPIKNIFVAQGYDSDNDGYGGTIEWKWTFLSCSSCNKKTKTKRNEHTIHYGAALKEDYLELTGRPLDLKELKAIFKQNNSLFHRLYDVDYFLKKEVMSNPKLEKKIETKKLLIKKHEKELENLEREYRGQPPYGDR